MKFHSEKIKNFFAAFIVIFSLACCHNYYKASKIATSPPTERTVDSLKQHGRYFILRDGKKAFYMNNIVMSDDRRVINCTLDTLPDNHKLYLTYGRKGRMLYKKSNPADKGVLNEVHFFIDPAESTSVGNYTLQLDKVQKIEVIEKDKGRTTGSYILGAVGYTFGSIALVAIIVAATKSSCPFVSAYTGNEFELQGEIFGGAIYPQLARDDYMPLRMQPTSDGKLMVKISNELKEKQYTDFADLLVISHDKNSKVLADEKGNLYSISNPQIPEKAWTTNGQDVLPSLIKADDNQLLHFDDTLSANAKDYVITQFSSPANIQKAKLILSIKNSYWLDYLYGEVAKKFGSYYASYVKKQNKKPASELSKWAVEQRIPLEVSVKTKTGWQKITDLTTIGPLATRQVVVPLDLSNVTDKNIEIKLSSGFMFWEIDYAAVDFSDDRYFNVERISPSLATDETGKDVLPQLIKKDGNYLEQPVPGNAVTLEYKCKPQRDNTSTSYILQTRGYYTHSWDFKGSPNVAFLKSLKKPDAFSPYSLQLYKKFITNNFSSIAKQ